MEIILHLEQVNQRTRDRAQNNFLSHPPGLIILMLPSCCQTPGWGRLGGCLELKSCVIHFQLQAIADLLSGSPTHRPSCSGSFFQVQSSSKCRSQGWTCCQGYTQKGTLDKYSPLMTAPICGMYLQKLSCSLKYLRCALNLMCQVFLTANVTMGMFHYVGTLFLIL